MTLLTNEVTWETVTKLCAGMDPNVFFPEIEWGRAEREQHMQEAKKICSMCPAQAMCLDRNGDERFGVFGNTTPDERVALGRLPVGWKACGVCDTPFKPQNQHHVYCGDKCRSRARSLTQRRYEQRKKVGRKYSATDRSEYNARRRERRRAQAAGSEA